MIDSIISIDLQETIIAIIKQQCLRYRNFEKQVQSLFYEPYTQRRNKYPVTAMVLSGFAPNVFKKEGVEVVDLKYGLKTNPLFQPELITDTAVIQIYSNGANPLENNIVKDRCEKYNGSKNSLKHFVIIRFFVNKKGYLKKIEAIYPNEKCKVVETKQLYIQSVIEYRATAG